MKDVCEMIYYEPVNLKQWNMFENITSPGQTETFLATKSMKCGDMLLIYVGKQDKRYESGIYAYGTVVDGPFLLENSPDDYCNGKRTVLLRFDKISCLSPLFTYEECKHFVHQFRTPHRIDPTYYPMIEERLGLSGEED